MPMQVCNGANLFCSFGVAPSSLVVLPLHRVNTQSQPAANITDNAPLVNIQPFGMCSSPANPTVIAATAAKLGVFTPMPCIPATMTPWTPGAPNVTVASMPALDSTSMLTCMWGGIIQVVNPGELTVTEP